MAFRNLETFENGRAGRIQETDSGGNMGVVPPPPKKKMSKYGVDFKTFVCSRFPPFPPFFLPFFFPSFKILEGGRAIALKNLGGAC